MIGASYDAMSEDEERTRRGVVLLPASKVCRYEQDQRKVKEGGMMDELKSQPSSVI
jgi:hypothetical protein